MHVTDTEPANEHNADIHGDSRKDLARALKVVEQLFDEANAQILVEREYNTALKACNASLRGSLCDLREYRSQQEQSTDAEAVKTVVDFMWLVLRVVMLTGSTSLVAITIYRILSKS